MLVSLFNSFPFHFEVFGVFIDYLVRRIPPGELKIRIYTNQNDELHWLDFYKSRYSSELIQYFHFEQFDRNTFNESDYIIVTTDDDTRFYPMMYLSLPNAHKKIIAYDHHIRLRSGYFQQHIGTRPFPTAEDEYRRNMPYMYPVYPLISIEEKRSALAAESMINLIIVGGTYNSNNFWNYLMEKNDMSKIRIFYIHRRCPSKWLPFDTYLQSVCPNTDIYENCDTALMYTLLKRSHYALMMTEGIDFIHHACSGSIGLAYSTGCTMIMPRIYNTDYKFKNALYFEDAPLLTASPDLDIVYNERAEIIEHNDTVLGKLIQKQ